MIKDFRRTDRKLLKTKFSNLGILQGNTEQVQTTHSWLPRGSNQHAAMQYLLDSADGLHHDLQKYCNTRMIKKHSIN